MPESPSLPFQLTAFPPDRFQLLELLGQGGMGQVYRARDRHLNRPVALKFVLAQETPGSLVRLVLEAQYQAALDHPHIAKVHGVGTWEGRTCVMMQLVEGRGLDAGASEFSVEQKVRLVAQAARGMHAAHLHGLVHRDLKPQNILVESRPGGGLHAYVVDFGLARAADSQSLTLSGTILGSPHYMSPEQALGGRLVDARSDVYSLGATLYAVLTGSPPFASPLHAPGEEATLPEALASAAPALPASPLTGCHALAVLRRVVDEPPAPPRSLAPRLSRDLETILLKCLEKDPAQRYPSAQELAEDLERCLAGNPIRARRASWSRRLRAWGRRHPRSTSLLAAACLVGLAALPLAGVAVRRARQRSEIASAFEQAARQLEDRFRMGALSPRQNRAQETARLQGLMESRGREAERLGAPAAGPGAFFRGRALLLLGRNREALRELERARSLGFDSPYASRVLGSALLEVYMEEMRRLGSRGSRREADRKALEERYFRPAIQGFQRGAATGEHPDLNRALVAYLQGEDGPALQHVQAELEHTPWLPEAHRLRYLVLSRTAEQALDLPTFEARARDVEAQLATLTDVARGDPQSHLDAAHWWFFKGRRLAYRFRVLRPEAIRRGLDLAAEAAQLDPASPDPPAARAEGWGHLADLLTQVGRPAAELKACFEAALADADQALQRDPRSLASHLSKAYARLMRHEAALGPADDLDQALADADRALAIEPTTPEAFRLKAMAHLSRARRAVLQGRDGRPHLQAWVEIQRDLYRQWPTSRDYALNLCNAYQRMAFSDAAGGNAPQARAGLAQARALLERDLGVHPLPPNLRLHRIRQARLEATLEGLLGGAAGPGFERALAEHAALPADLRAHPDFLDEQYTLVYEQATLVVEQGGDPAPQLQVLSDLLARWEQAGWSKPWLLANRVMLLRLRSRDGLRTGRPGRAAQEAMQVIRQARGERLTRSEEIWSGVEGCLQVHAARQAPPGARAAQYARAVRLLEASFGLDDSLRWTFRLEYRMAKGR